MILNIHNIVNIRLNNESRSIRTFIKDELGYFIDSDSNLADIDIFFVKKINNLKDFTDISDSLKYFKNTICLQYGGGFMSIQCFDDNCSKVEAYVEESVDNFWVLYLIEKLLMVILPTKGYIFMHASASTNNNMEATIYTGFQSAGKTKNVLEDIDQGDEFLGDELIIVDKDANCYCYPRRINIHKFNTNKYWRIFGKRILSEVLNLRPLKYIEMLMRHAIRGKSYRGYIRLSIFESSLKAVISNNARIVKLVLFDNKENDCLAFNSIESQSELTQYLLNSNLGEYFSRIEKNLLIGIVDENIQKISLSKCVKKSTALHTQILAKFITSVDKIEILTKS